MPHGPKQAGIAKLRIGQHAGAGEAAGAHLPEQGERLAPLRLQPDTPGSRARSRAASVSHASGT